MQWEQSRLPTGTPVFIDKGEMEEIVNGTRIEATGGWVQQKSLAGFNIGSHALYSRRDSIAVGSQFPWRLDATLSFAGVNVVLNASESLNGQTGFVRISTSVAHPNW